MKQCIYLGPLALALLLGCGGSDSESDDGSNAASGASGAGTTATGGAGGSGAGGSGSGAAPSGGSAGSGMGGTAPGAGGSVTNDPTLADEIESQVVGTYAARMIVTTMQEVPLLGPSEATSTSIGLTTIARTGEAFEMVEAGCHVEAASGGGVMTEIPDVIAQTTPASASQLSFAREGEAIVWSRPQTITLVSVALTDPAAEALPTSGTDPRVLDQDNDGNPGVTVKVSGLATGDIFVVQRNRTAYQGSLDGDGLLSGLISDASDQSVVGSSNPLLNQNIPTTPHEDPSRSTIELVRVDDSYDCARVVSEAGALFGG